jgi:hypothetical protein
VPEKDLKKMILWTMIIVPHAKSLHEIPISPFIDVILSRNGIRSTAKLPPVNENLEEQDLEIT